MTGGDVTLRDIWEAQHATDAKVSGLALQFAQFTAAASAQMDAGSRRMADHEERLRAVEQAPKVAPAQAADIEERLRRLEEFRTRWAGALIVLSLLLSALVAFLSHAGLVKAG